VHHPTHPLSLRVKHTHARHNEEEEDDDHHHHHQNLTKKTDGHQTRVGCEDLILSPQEVKRREKTPTITTHRKKSWWSFPSLRITIVYNLPKKINK
jgi:hypothetical protein